MRSSLMLSKRHFFFMGTFCFLCIMQSNANAQRAAGYAAGARSSTTSNTMLDNVVGNRQSPIKTQTKVTGAHYHITENGNVIAPNGLVVNAGCLRNSDGTTPKQGKYRFDFTAQKKNFETVIIGVSDQPRISSEPLGHKDEHTDHRATLNASFGPTNFYVVPRPCINSKLNDRSLTMDAAASLASANGNAFALAGNRDDVIEADTAHILPNGDIELVSTPPYGPTDVRVAP
ncbi:hypothetical protein [Aristophania vespae]|uniref:hypothetical protein n=1 Tax=Aristophania vespae TaxID=2697033 RepID=UPI0023511E6A|nr:hypothetical protein [Aristophania vespae]UMM64449.1 hypothetical protein DM15PD_14630 [Aristophania vespae]